MTNVDKSRTHADRYNRQHRYYPIGSHGPQFYQNPQSPAFCHEKSWHYG